MTFLNFLSHGGIPGAMESCFTGVEYVLLALSIAAAAAGTGVSVAAQQDAAKNQRVAAKNKAQFEQEQLLTRTRENREAAGLEKEQASIKGLRELGKVRALGLTGISADAVLADVRRRTARERDISGRNLEIQQRAAGNALRASGLSLENTLSGIQDPSIAGAILTGVSGAAGAASGFDFNSGDDGALADASLGLFGSNNSAGSSLLIPEIA